MAGRVTRVLEHMLSKREILSSDPSAAKKKKINVACN
jgi:hypothetical protein